MPKRPQPRRGPLDRKPEPSRSAKPAAGVSGNEGEIASPVSFPPLPGPPAPAVALFEDAMRDLQNHAYQQAAGGFRTLLERYPTERALLDRSRVYLELCERELRRRPSEPHTIEEQLTAATAALNNGDEDGAERLAKAVLAQDQHHDLALYLLAVIEARRGAVEAALSYLERAVEISPEAGAQARFDGDFESVRDTETFRRLTEHQTNSTGSGTYRRLRRPRGER
jgi:tetratricopeptide (TPR) repeat protein